MAYEYYTTRTNKRKFLVYDRICIHHKRYINEDKLELIRKILEKSNINCYLRDVPDVFRITILQTTPSVIQFSLKQNEPDDPYLLYEQIRFFQETLPEHITIAPYKTKNTVYKFSINLDNELFHGMDKSI